MNPKLFTTLCWTLWGILAVGVVVACVMLLTDRSRSPEVGSGVSKLLAAFLLLLLGGSGLLVHWLTSKQSVAWMIVLALVLAIPVFVAVARPLKLAFDRWQADREAARVGSFEDPVAAAMAQAILNDDAATLRSLLQANPPPTVVDRAGVDLVGLAIHCMDDRRGSIEPLKALLQAGADPRQARLQEGRLPLTLLILSTYRNPHAHEAIELLLQHQVDPNALDPCQHTRALNLAGNKPQLLNLLLDYGADPDQVGEYGYPPVVSFIGSQCWESALILIERGARLDIVSPSGISVDYYLNNWRISVNGNHPEGWDRVRAAIAARRERESTTP